MALGKGGGRAELRKQAKGERRKVALAARLRAETTVTVAWIAARLAMGTPGYLNNRLYRWRKGLRKRVYNIKNQPLYQTPLCGASNLEPGPPRS